MAEVNTVNVTFQSAQLSAGEVVAGTVSIVKSAAAGYVFSRLIVKAQVYRAIRVSSSNQPVVENEILTEAVKLTARAGVPTRGLVTGKYIFAFSNADLSLESFRGSNVTLRYYLRVFVTDNAATTSNDFEFVVVNRMMTPAAPAPSPSQSHRLQLKASFNDPYMNVCEIKVTFPHNMYEVNGEMVGRIEGTIHDYIPNVIHLQLYRTVKVNNKSVESQMVGEVVCDAMNLNWTRNEFWGSVTIALKDTDVTPSCDSPNFKVTYSVKFSYLVSQRTVGMQCVVDVDSDEDKLGDDYDDDDCFEDEDEDEDEDDDGGESSTGGVSSAKVVTFYRSRR